VTGTPSGNVTYAYDAFGRRMSKTVGSSTTYYLYDGDALIAEVDASTEQVTKAYTWGADGLVSDHSGTQSRFYLFDALGNVRSLLDPNGNLLASAAYTAYGTPIGTPLPSTPFGWQGQAGCYSDSETGLVYMQARYYAPRLGRFVSRDPIGFAGGINLYAYCCGDPVNYFYQSGLQSGSMLLAPQTDKYAGPNFKGEYDALELHAKGCGHVPLFLTEYIIGLGPTSRYYHQGSVEVEAFRGSRGAMLMRQQLASNGYRQGWVPNPMKEIPHKSRYWNGIKGTTSYINTILQPWNGTQTQIGSFNWNACVHGNYEHIYVDNKADVDSLFYHLPHILIPGYYGWDRAHGGFGPMGTIYQRLDWVEPIPPQYRK